MNIKKVSSNITQLVITGMIVDDTVLGSIASKWSKEGMLKVSWCNLIGQWCVDYYEAHNKAPGANIENIFLAWAEGHHDKETANLVERFLQSLSGQYDRQKKQLNAQFVLDKAGELFNRIKLEKHADLIKGLVDTKKIDQAIKKANEFEPVSIGKGSAVSLFRDMAAIDRAFVSRSEPLIVYPGDLGHFFSGLFIRDTLIGFMGREKSGKTYWLVDIAFNAALQRKKVLFFQIGDLSEAEVLMRFATRATKCPANKDDLLVKWPVKLERTQDGSYSYILESKEVKRKQITPQLAKDALKKIAMDTIRSTKQDYLMIETYANDSMDIVKMRGIVAQYARAGWVPDFIVVDYADLLAAPIGMQEGRDAINKNWKGLKRLSQDYHCCVVTATQSDADSYGSSLMNLSNFSEDKRKYSHVNTMFSINRTDDEMEDQVARLAIMLSREKKVSTKKVVFCAGCYAISNPAVLTTY